MFEQLPKSATTFKGDVCGLTLHWSTTFQCFFIGYFGIRHAQVTKLIKDKYVGRGETIEIAISDFIKRSRQTP